MAGRNPSEEYGKIKIIRKPRGKKYDEIVNFLRSIACGYAKFNSEFYRIMKRRELTLGWGEAQNQSIIWHSMRESRYRAIPFSEYSYKLKGKGKRLDYQVLLRGIKTVLWMEYNHAAAFINRRKRFDPNNVTINSLNGIVGKWEDDVNRLRAMNREKCDDLCFGSPQEGWHTVRINLLVLPICRKINKLEGEALSKEEGRPIGHEILYSWSKPILRWWDSKTAPNFVAAWSLLDDLQLLQPWPDPEKKKTMWWEVYYGVYFFAWLDSLAD